MNKEVLSSVIEAEIFFYPKENDFGKHLKVKKVKDVTGKELFC